VDGIVLACAGLERLGFSPTRIESSFEGAQFFLEILSREVFLPAVVRESLLSKSALMIKHKSPSRVGSDRETLLCLQAEREFLSRLHSDCNFPVGVNATISNGR